MTLLQKTAAAFALFLVSGTAHAQAYKVIGDWSIYKNEDNCRALSIRGQTILSVAYYKSANRTTTMILNDTELAAARTGTTFDAQLVFVKNDDVDTTFASLPLAGVQLDSGTKGVLATSSGDSLLTTIGQSTIIGLVKGGEVLVSVKIDKPTEMESTLRKCASGG